MKKIILILTIIILIPALTFGQLKKDLKQPDFSNILTKSSYENSLFSFIDPSKMNMSHSVSMSYSSFGGQSIFMNTYVNTIDYQINDQVSIRTDLGIMASPYNTLPNNSSINNNKFFGGAEINYRPNENTIFSLRFDSTPYMYYRPSIWDSRYLNSSFRDW